MRFVKFNMLSRCIDVEPDFDGAVYVNPTTYLHSSHPPIITIRATIYST